MEAAAALHWSVHEEIHCVQHQRNPGEMVGAGVAAAWCWSSCEETPRVQRQRTSPSKMVGGANSHLESNPISVREAQRAETNTVHTRTQGPHRD